MASSLCGDSTYVFANFSNLLDCNNEFGSWPTTKHNAFTETVWTCVNDYCETPDPNLKGCEGWTGGPFNFIVYPPYWSSFESSEVCGGINDEPNADIAGPGVYISYLIQLGIVFYLFLLLRAFRLFPTLFSWITRTIPSQKAPPSKSTKSAMTHYFTEHDLALRTVLVEFQEAQCWFMLVSQAAILAAQAYRRVFEASTLQMLWTNQGLALMISSAGILPVVVAIWSLHKWHRNSPWIFFLGCATVVLSEVTLYMVRMPQADHLTPIESNSFPDTCGGHPPPLIYCVNTDDSVNMLIPAVVFFVYLNPLCLAIWILTIIMWIWTYAGENTDPTTRRGALLSRLGILKFHAWGRGILESRKGRWIRLLLHVLSFLVEALLVVAVSLDAMCFWRIRHAGSINFGAWSFGQLIAITLWLLVVSKYFLILGGIKSYSYSRFPRPYKIVKQRDNEGDKISGLGDVEFTLISTSTERLNNSNIEGHRTSNDQV